MIILMHVLIALASVAVATGTFFKPTMNKLYVSYGFIIATVASGTALLIASPTDLLRACLSGLLYVSVISTVTVASHVKVRKAILQTYRSE